MHVLGRCLAVRITPQPISHLNLGLFNRRLLRAGPLQALLSKFQQPGMPPRKKKAPEVDDDDDADEALNSKTSGKKDNAGGDEKPKKRQRVKKEKEPEEIHTAHEGPVWTVVPPSLMYRCFARQGGSTAVSGSTILLFRSPASPDLSSLSHVIGKENQNRQKG